jgi:hypothetical protein
VVVEDAVGEAIKASLAGGSQVSTQKAARVGKKVNSSLYTSLYYLLVSEEYKDKEKGPPNKLGREKQPKRLANLPPNPFATR